LYIARAPKLPHKAISINMKRVFPAGTKVRTKAIIRMEIVRLAVNSILYRSSLFIYYFIRPLPDNGQFLTKILK
jgi:hypothetical protein